MVVNSNQFKIYKCLGLSVVDKEIMNPWIKVSSCGKIQ